MSYIPGSGHDGNSTSSVFFWLCHPYLLEEVGEGSGQGQEVTEAMAKVRKASQGHTYLRQRQ